MISRCLEGDLNLMKQPSNTQTLVLHWDGNVKSKEDDKITKYAPLEAKIQESFHVQTESIPIIVGALGTIPSRLLGFLKAIGLPDVIGSLQTSALLGTQRILRNTLVV